MDRQRTECSSCQAPVFFARFKSTGSLTPFNFEPDPKGNVIFDEDGAATVVIKGSVIEKPVPPETPRYMNHFVTCPSRARHRKSKTQGE